MSKRQSTAITDWMFDLRYNYISECNKRKEYGVSEGFYNYVDEHFGDRPALNMRGMLQDHARVVWAKSDRTRPGQGGYTILCWHSTHRLKIKLSAAERLRYNGAQYGHVIVGLANLVDIVADIKVAQENVAVDQEKINKRTECLNVLMEFAGNRPRTKISDLYRRYGAELKKIHDEKMKQTA